MARLSAFNRDGKQPPDPNGLLPIRLYAAGRWPDARLVLRWAALRLPAVRGPRPPPIRRGCRMTPTSNGQARRGTGDPQQDVLCRLKGVVAGNGGSTFSALCPAHEDAKRSLSVSITDGGTVLLKCHAGCNTKAVVEALDLNMVDLFPDTGTTRGNGVKTLGPSSKPTTTPMKPARCYSRPCATTTRKTSASATRPATGIGPGI